MLKKSSFLFAINLLSINYISWIAAVAIFLHLNIGEVRPLSNDSSQQPQGNHFSDSIAPRPEDLLLVQGGVFQMGCPPAYPPGCYNDEKPNHTVRISDFHLSRYEVTNAEFVRFLNEQRSSISPDAKQNTFRSKGHNFLYLQSPHSTVKQQIGYENGLFYAIKGFEQHPAMRLSWFAAQAYCHWLRQKTGQPYRLPTEAEWEWAARGGRQSKGYFYAGSNQVDSVAWFWDNSNKTSHPIAQKQPNELGFHDLSGNVWEWCADWEGPYVDSTQVNPSGPNIGKRRVARGGSWNYEAWNCRVIDRYYVEPESMRHVVGFRVALGKIKQ